MAEPHRVLVSDVLPECEPLIILWMAKGRGVLRLPRPCWSSRRSHGTWSSLLAARPSKLCAYKSRYQSPSLPQS